MWQLIIPVALQLISFFLNQKKMNDEAKKKFYEFIEVMQGQNGSVKLSQSYREQLKKLQEAVAPLPPQV